MDPSNVEPVDAAAMPPDGQLAIGTEPMALALTPPLAPAVLPPGPTIPPLAIPWLHHDLFPNVKKVCSESGLPQAKKTSVLRVLQELKKGRNRIDQQLTELELQLLHVSDFLSGATSTLELAPDAAADQVPVANGHSVEHNGKSPIHAAETGDKSTPIDPVATLVEEDLASETPCTTVGLWRYLSVYPFFKTVTLEDMQEALLLEDPAIAAATESHDTDITDAADLFESVDALPPLEEKQLKHDSSNGSATAMPSVHELLKMRLLGALIPETTQRENGQCIEEDQVKKEAMKDGDDVERSVADTDVVMTPWQATPRTLQRLRDVGLVEVTTDEITQNLSHRQDDQVSSEIRLLQTELVHQVRRNNEVKRTLRRTLERLKPWLTHDEEYQQIETKFEKMWRRKKELQRKKKHKEKKMQRKEAASYKSAHTMPALSS